MPDPGTSFAKRLTTGRLYLTPVGQSYEEDLGNVVKFKRMDRTDTVEHLSSVGGVRIVDGIFVHTLAFGYLFTLDEYVDRVLLLLQKAQGPLAAVTTPAVAAGSLTVNGVVPGGTYAVGVNNLTSLSIGVGGVTKLRGADYTADFAAGRFTILTTGTIAAGATLTVGYTAAAYGYRTIVSGRLPTLQGSLAFYEYDQQSTVIRAEHLFNGSLWVNGDAEEQTTGFRTLDLHVQCGSPPVINERA